MDIIPFRYKLNIPLCLMAALTIFTTCSKNNHKPEVVITVGDRQVTEDDFKREIRYFTQDIGISNQQLRDFIEPLIKKIVDHFLILEYGRDQGITVSDEELASVIKEIRKDYPDNEFREVFLQQYIDFEEWKRDLKEQILVKKILSKVSERITPVSFNEIKAYFDLHRKEFKYPQMVQFEQIVTSTEKEAKEVIRRMRNGEDMAALAREYSIAPEAENGGLVGWVARSDLEESMAEMIFALPVGKMSPILQTPYGFHVFKVSGKRPEGPKTLPEAMNEIEARLLNEKEKAYYKEWMNELRQRFPVKINLHLIKKMELG